MKEKGCFNCSNKRNLDKIYYKCTEMRSQPNLTEPNGKATGFLRDVKTPLGSPRHSYRLGCSCEYWKSERETVEFT